MTLTLFGTFLCGGLPLVLGLGNPVPTGKAVELNDAGVERSWLPVKRVLKSVKTSTGRSTSGWDSTVVIPLPGTNRNGDDERVTHRLITGEQLNSGDNVYVAYAPSRTGIGVIADNDKDWVERKLSEPTLNETWYGILGMLWGVSVVGWLLSFRLATRSQRFPRKLRGDELALRARITGGKHLTGVGNALSLTVWNNDWSGEIEFFLAEEAERHFAAAGTQDGTLVWHPARNRRRGRKAPARIGANFVADAGWHIPGELRIKDAESVVVRGSDSFELDKDGEAGLLDIHGAWPLTVSRLVLWLALGMAICAVVLTLPVQLGGARLALGMVGTFTPLLVATIQAIRKVTPGGQEGDAETGSASPA